MVREIDSNHFNMVDEERLLDSHYPTSEVDEDRVRKKFIFL